MILSKEFKEDDRDMDLISRMCNDILDDDFSSIDEKIEAATVRDMIIKKRMDNRRILIDQLF